MTRCEKTAALGADALGWALAVPAYLIPAVGFPVGLAMALAVSPAGAARLARSLLDDASKAAWTGVVTAALDLGDHFIPREETAA